MKLGFDIGTTTISCVVLKENRVIDSKTIINDSFICDTKTQDVNQIIMKSMNLINEFISKYPIQSIGLTGQMHGILYLNEQGESISPLYTWQDECASSIVDEINKYTKHKVSSGYGFATYIYHIQQNQVPHNTKNICTIMDYFGMKLTNRETPLMHVSNAASLGFFDVEKNEFEKEVLKQFQVEIVPQITKNIEKLGTYQKIPVYVAIGDNQASFLGTVGNNTNTVLVNMGTGGQISLLTNEYVQINGIETRPFLCNQYLLVGASLCGGKAYALLEKFFREYVKEATGIEISQYEVMERLANKASNSLQVCTTFNGTRTNPNQTGFISNITEDNLLPEYVILGFMHGMIDEMFEMYQKMICVNQNILSIMASGNGFRKNEALQKICEEKFQLPLKITSDIEEAACGAAMSTNY